MMHKAGANVSLPLLTIIYARGAKPIGAFGLVAGGFTILYQASDLGLNLSCTIFTNHYHRGEGLTTDSDL